LITSSVWMKRDCSIKRNANEHMLFLIIREREADSQCAAALLALLKFLCWCPGKVRDQEAFPKISMKSECFIGSQTIVCFDF
ncbi:hypothetical protein T11_10114, partial [Trichinella zimbabwensis]